MNRPSGLTLCGAIAWIAAFGTESRGSLVDLSFLPESQTVETGDTVFIDLIATSADGTLQKISGIDAILEWDPAYLQLVMVSDPNAEWLLASFLPDPDGINDDVTDGQALFTALAIPAALPAVPPDLTVTRIEFTALLPTEGTVLSMAPSAGSFAETRVFGDGIQVNVTGDISGTATVIINEPPLFCEGTCALCDGDANCDGAVDPLDAGGVLARFGWDPCDLGVCQYDVNCDGQIDPLDAGYVLARLSECDPVPACSRDCP